MGLVRLFNKSFEASVWPPSHHPLVLLARPHPLPRAYPLPRFLPHASLPAPQAEIVVADNLRALSMIGVMLYHGIRNSEPIGQTCGHDKVRTHMPSRAPLGRDIPPPPPPR